MIEIDKDIANPEPLSHFSFLLSWSSWALYLLHSPGETLCRRGHWAYTIELVIRNIWHGPGEPLAVTSCLSETLKLHFVDQFDAENVSYLNLLKQFLHNFGSNHESIGPLTAGELSNQIIKFPEYTYTYIYTLHILTHPIKSACSCPLFLLKHLECVVVHRSSHQSWYK